RAADRGQREQGDTAHENALAPEMITKRAARWYQSGQGQGVATDDPFQPSGRKVKLTLHGWKGHANDQDVEHHHALSHARHREGQPLPWSRPQSHNHSLPDLTRPAASASPLLRQARAASSAITR